MDDNIIINCCEDSYVFKEGPGNNPIVQNTRKTEYEALRMGATVQPHMFYGEFISLDEAKAKGVLAPKAIHRHATPENVFFDDTRICYFNLSLSRQGKKAAVQFSRTFHDLRYFTRIYFPEEYFIRKKRITVTIPAALSRFRLVEKNFGPGIRCEKSVNKEGDSLFVYTLKGVPATRKEEAAPADNCLYPHLLVTGPFADVQAMYRWLNGLAEVDCTLPQAEMLTDEITAGCTDELEKIRRTYAYVQQNIRYIAFENGLAGHRPDRPAEVLRKRYGDCKGMALLLRTLLKAQGFDARMAYIGTDDIASSPDEVPTLAAINHAFCLLFHQGKRYCLDATYRYLPPEDIPQGIQGRKALVENGDSCLILTLPQQDASASTDSLNYHYRLMTDSNPPTLKGTATRVSTGEYKEYLLSLYHDTPKEKQTDLLNNQINNTAAVQSADGEYCLEADPHEDFFHQPIDTTRRKQDYLLPWRCRIVREVTIDIPQGYAVSYLPADFHIETNQGILSCSYRKYSINSLVYWVTYVHNVVYSFYRSMIYCYINSTQRCAGSIVIDIIPTNGADKRKFFPFAPYFPVTNVIKRYFYPYFPAIIGIKGYSFPYFPYLSGIMKIKTALYSLFSRLDWHKTVVFPCLGEIYEGIRSLSWEIPVT